MKTRIYSGSDSNKVHKIFSLLPTPDCLLPIPYSRFPIPDSLLPTPDCLLPIPYSRFPTPDSLLPIPDSRFPIP
ncbi:hypothetical protein [Moorena sp. SIO3I6]|uniref:hypothetical protein n=1 Tax=Moorena sp. SIO3I6 TaxID=2607831 RepID=UPI0013F888ED|nr:hypothetical protein [Moorena sp. SIO3I6]NEP25420.1 hypothetical protein [Moorena sp. SIO3I6]